MRADIQIMQLYVDTMVGITKFSYPAKRNAPKPADEFAHISLLEEYQRSIPAQYIHSQDGDTTTFRTYSLAELRFRVGIVDTDNVASTRIMHGWTSETMKALMISSGYGFYNCKPISLEDEKLERHEWEPRQGVSVELYVTRVLEEVVNNITSVLISGTYVTPIESILLNFEINEA